MGEPVHVLHVVKGLGPGGAERLLVVLARTTDPERVTHEVAYVVPAKSHLAGELEGAGVRVHCLGGGHAGRWVPALRAVVAAARPHVVHAHSPLAAAAGRLVARSFPRARRPVTVSTEHNRWPAYHPATRLANALTFALDRRHLAVSEDARQSVWRPWRATTEVVHHGIDVAAVASRRAARDSARAGLGVAPGEVLAVTVANYRPAKDHRTLLAAARQVLDAGAPVRFAVAGQGPLEADVRRRHHDLGLGHRVALLGHRPDVLDLLAAADLFVLSSRHEGIPVALMEALAMGLPVVATAVGGIPEAVESGREGLLVPPGDPAALAAGVLALARDPERRRQMAGAAARRAPQFDARRAARRLEDLYHEVRP